MIRAETQPVSYTAETEPKAAVDLSIIIINWKSCAFVQQCLTSIFTNARDLKCEVIVVDNASYDGCDQMVKSQFPEVVFLQSDDNLGFAGANNRAFSQCRGRNVLFLNPDTEILGGALEKLVSSLESIPTAGMVGARLLNSDLTLQTTCITAIPSILNQALSSDYLRKTFPKWRTWGMRPLFDGTKAPVPVAAISGACMLARRHVIQCVGGFTRDYFMYSEDMDLCVKIAKLGWKIYYVPDAGIVHHAGGSSSSRKENNFSSIMLRESVKRFMELHRGGFYALLYRGSTAFMAVCRILLLILALPVYNPGRQLTRALSKWSGILAWSLGLKHWVSRPEQNAGALAKGPKESTSMLVGPPSAEQSDASRTC